MRTRATLQPTRTVPEVYFFSAATSFDLNSPYIEQIPARTTFSQDVPTREHFWSSLQVVAIAQSASVPTMHPESFLNVQLPELRHSSVLWQSAVVATSQFPSTNVHLPSVPHSIAFLQSELEAILHEPPTSEHSPEDLQVFDCAQSAADLGAQRSPELSSSSEHAPLSWQAAEALHMSALLAAQCDVRAEPTEAHWPLCLHWSDAAQDASDAKHTPDSSLKAHRPSLAQCLLAWHIA